MPGSGGRGAGCHHVLKLDRVHELLELGDLPVPQVPDVAHLGTDRPARRLARVCVPSLDGRDVACVVVGVGRDREAVPFRAQLRRGCSPPHRGRPTLPRSACMGFLPPRTSGSEGPCAQHRGDVSLGERVVESRHKIRTAHGIPQLRRRRSGSRFRRSRAKTS